MPNELVCNTSMECGIPYKLHMYWPPEYTRDCTGVVDYAMNKSWASRSSWMIPKRDWEVT